MALISIPNVFSAGAVIIASQHNSNFSTIANAINGGLDNTNLTGSAGITYANLTLTGQIVNADIASGAGILGSKTNMAIAPAIGSTTPNTGAFSTLKVGTTNQGDILYDNGTSLVRLTPGTSGQFLQTQGASANPQWATLAAPSNVIFCWGSGDSAQYYTQASSTPAAAPTLLRQIWQQNNVDSAYHTVITTRFKKISGISTLTLYLTLISRNGGGLNEARMTLNSGGVVSGNATANGAAGVIQWQSTTADVSGLTNGTVYDLTIDLASDGTCGVNATFGGIIFGS